MENGQSLRVMVADDSVLFREGVARLLVEAGFAVTARVGDAPALLECVREDPPDVAIVDIRMPPTHTTEGLDAARTLREKHPAVGVLVLSAHVEPQYALQLLESGAERAGYLLKERLADLEELSEAVRRIAAGGLVIDPSVVAQLVGRKRTRSPLDDLTDREREVLARDGGGPVQPGDLPAALPQPQDGRGVRALGVHQARPAPGGRRQPPGAGRAGVPAGLTHESRVPARARGGGRCHDPGGHRGRRTSFPNGNATSGTTSASALT